MPEARRRRGRAGRGRLRQTGSRAPSGERALNAFNAAARARDAALAGYRGVDAEGLYPPSPKSLATAPSSTATAEA